MPESKEHFFWKKTMGSRIEKILTFCCDNINHVSRLHAHAHGEQIVHLMIWKQLTHGPHLMILETRVRPETYSIAALWKAIKWHRSSEERGCPGDSRLLRSGQFSEEETCAPEDCKAPSWPYTRFSLWARVNRHPPMHHPLDGCHHSVVDERQLS